MHPLICKLIFSDDEDDFHDAVTDPDYAQFSVSCPPPKHKRSGSSVSGCRLVHIHFIVSQCLISNFFLMSFICCQNVKAVIAWTSCHPLKPVVCAAQEVTELLQAVPAGMRMTSRVTERVQPSTLSRSGRSKSVIRWTAPPRAPPTSRQSNKGQELGAGRGGQECQRNQISPFLCGVS